MPWDTLIGRIDTVTVRANAAADAMVRVDAASQRFGGVLDKIGQSAGFGVPGSTRTSGADLLAMLEDVIRREEKARKDPNTEPMQLFMLNDSIQKIYTLIREWTGAAGQDFTLEKFRAYLADRDAKSDATVIDIVTRTIASATSGIRISGGSLYRPKGTTAPDDGLPSDEDVMRAQAALYKLDDTGALIEKKIADITQDLDREQKLADTIKSGIDETNAAIDAGEQKLRDMAAAAGVSDASGAGAQVKGLADTLKEAQARLQYLTDKGADARTVADAQKSIDDLRLRLDDAQKQLRIATYEFEHSEAYALQQKEIADQKEALKAKEEEQKAEDVRLKAVQARIDAEKKRLDDLDVRRRQQQAIIDAKRLADDTKQAADARKELEDSLKTLHGESSKFLGSFAATSKAVVTQINDATLALMKAIPGVQIKGGPVPYSGHTPKPPSIDIAVSTLSL